MKKVQVELMRFYDLPAPLDEIMATLSSNGYAPEFAKLGIGTSYNSHRDSEANYIQLYGYRDETLEEELSRAEEHLRGVAEDVKSLEASARQHKEKLAVRKQVLKDLTVELDKLKARQKEAKP